METVARREVSPGLADIANLALDLFREVSEYKEGVYIYTYTFDGKQVEGDLIGEGIEGLYYRTDKGATVPHDILIAVRQNRFSRVEWLKVTYTPEGIFGYLTSSDNSFPVTNPDRDQIKKAMRILEIAREKRLKAGRS